MKPLALALSGGGVRGAAHLGVLLALEQANIPITAIAGTSSGAIAAMLFVRESPELRHQTHQKLEQIGRKGYAELEYLFHPPKALSPLKVVASWEKVIRGGVFGAGLVSIEALRSSLIALVGGARFEDAPIPLGFLAVDILSGERCVLREGSILEAALASSAIPGVFPPVQIGNRSLVDGNVLENVPVSVARELISGTFVLAVDVGDESSPPVQPKTALEVILRAAHLSRNALRHQSLRQADMVLSLTDLPGGVFEFGQTNALFEGGYTRTKALIPKLLQALEQ
ncbi:MAG: patatin-like phospholipase family protein [Deinococcales bacterium]